ncbi:hypothetical protein ACT3CD_11460 [Geofilum sp. OHC36d9]|uniref:hypothetical protein n=1 Tax=Geofilum sp. OHC36d9 TaxID=3458413 RepID=UPI004033B3CA
MNKRIFMWLFLSLLIFMGLCFVVFRASFKNKGGWTGWDKQSKEELIELFQADFENRKTIAGTNPEKLLNYVSELTRIKRNMPNITSLKLQSQTDSVALALGILMHDQFKIYEDLGLIDTSFIERNAQLALDALFAASWRDSVSMGVFREYILPYKLDFEIPDNWRDTLYRYHVALLKEQPVMADIDSLYAHHMVLSYYGLKSGNGLNSKYPSEPNFSWLAFSAEGDCVSRCRNVMYYLRAAGAPASFDYIPAWGNRPAARHAYVGLAHRKRQLAKLLENNNDPGNLVNDLNAAMFTGYMHVFEEDDLPPGWYVQYEKTIPKIYRETWTAQKEMLKLLKSVPDDQLDLDLITLNMLDVTAQYLKTVDVEIKKPLFSPWEIVYLATFDLGQWKPVAFSVFNRWNCGDIQNVATNVLYMPMVKTAHRLQPFDTPFILQADGRKQVLIPDYANRIDLHLVRKYPLFISTAMHPLDFKNCVVEGANKADFSDAQVLHVIKKYPFGMYRIALEGDHTFRFIRLRSSNNQPFRIAQMECYSGSHEKLRKLNNTLYTQGLLSGNDVKAFDGDLGSYMVRSVAVMDFGASENVTEIRICPLSDTNFIIPGNEYELFYWEGEWISAGRQVAEDYFLDYMNLPSNTLFWLRCLTEGREERIFTYENGTQIWW